MQADICECGIALSKQAQMTNLFSISWLHWGHGEVLSLGTEILCGKILELGKNEYINN